MTVIDVVAGGKDMITVFNRKELLVTTDLKRQANVQNLLAAKGIEAFVNTVNITEHGRAFGSNRSHTGSFGINQTAMYEYHIYVNRKDYEYARSLIGVIG